MKPLEQLGAADVAAIEGLVFDLDGTVLTDGVLSLDTYRALGALADAGLDLVVCTGRPAAWGEALHRQWPLALSVTENGAIAFFSPAGHLERIDRLAPEARGKRRARLMTGVEQLRSAFPELSFADDNLGRLSDITFDIGERRQVAPELVRRVRRQALTLGARSFVSSIHLHITLDADDKASGTIRALGIARGRDTTAALSRYAFVGDSANDDACFGAFRMTFGVSNVAPYLEAMTVGPRYVTKAAAGEGFVELADRLLALRAST